MGGKSDTVAKNYEFRIFIKLIWNNGKLGVTGVKEPDIPLPFRFLHTRHT